MSSEEGRGLEGWVVLAFKASEWSTLGLVRVNDPGQGAALAVRHCSGTWLKDFR